MKKVFNYADRNKWLIFILLIAAILRLYHLNFQSLWMDEIYTLNVTNPKFSLSQLNEAIKRSEAFPYLYYYLLRLLYVVFGYSSFVVRLLSVISGVFSVYYIYRFGRHLFSHNFGLIAAFLLSVNELHIQYSQEARPYNLYILFTIIAFYRLSIFIKNINTKNAILYGLAAAIMLNFNFFAALNLFSQGLILLIILITQKKEQRLKLFTLSFLSMLIVLLLFIHNISIIKIILGYNSFWVPAPTANSFSVLFAEFFGNTEITVFIFHIIIIYYFISLFNTKFNIKNGLPLYTNPYIYSAALFIFWFTGFFAIVLVKSYIGTSVVLTRYFLSLLPLFILVVATGIYAIKNQFSKIGVTLLIVVFTIINLTAIKKYYSLPHKSQYREVSQFITANKSDDDVVYSSLKEMYDYYLNNSDVKTSTVQKTLDEHLEDMIKGSSEIKAFWYADAHVRPFAITPEHETFLNQNFTLDSNYDGFDAWTRYYKLKEETKQQIDIQKFRPFKEVSGNEATYNIEAYDFNGTFLNISGWAFMKNRDSNSLKIRVLLINDSTAKVLETQTVIRKDVGDYFKIKDNIDRCGFKCSVNLTDFEEGMYKVGVYLKDNNIESLILTDKTVSIP